MVRYYTKFDYSTRILKSVELDIGVLKYDRQALPDRFYIRPFLWWESISNLVVSKSQTSLAIKKIMNRLSLPILTSQYFLAKIRSRINVILAFASD